MNGASRRIPSLPRERGARYDAGVTQAEPPQESGDLGALLQERLDSTTRELQRAFRLSGELGILLEELFPPEGDPLRKPPENQLSQRLQRLAREGRERLEELLRIPQEEWGRELPRARCCLCRGPLGEAFRLHPDPVCTDCFHHWGARPTPEA